MGKSTKIPVKSLLKNWNGVKTATALPRKRRVELAFSESIIESTD
jgi:hypothetical protein